MNRFWCIRHFIRQQERKEISDAAVGVLAALEDMRTILKRFSAAVVVMSLITLGSMVKEKPEKWKNEETETSADTKC